MNITKKQRTLKAIRQLIDKYRYPKYGNIYFSMQHCSLCLVHLSTLPTRDFSCRGCPLASYDGRSKCNSRTYETIKEINRTLETTFELVLIFPDLKKKQNITALKKRANFHELLYNKVKDLPKERFTRKGWKYISHEDIDRKAIIQ